MIHAFLKMKKLSDKEISNYLEKIELEIMLKYGVYQIERCRKRFV